MVFFKVVSTTPQVPLGSVGMQTAVKLKVMAGSTLHILTLHYHSIPLFTIIPLILLDMLSSIPIGWKFVLPDWMSIINNWYPIVCLCTIGECVVLCSVVYRDVPTVVGADHHSHKIATTTTQQPLRFNFDIHKITLYNGFLHSTWCLAATTILNLGTSLSVLCCAVTYLQFIVIDSKTSIKQSVQ